MTISILHSCFLPCNVAFVCSISPIYYSGNYDILVILALCFFGLSLIPLSVVTIILIIKLIKARTGVHLTIGKYSSLPQDLHFSDASSKTNKNFDLKNIIYMIAYPVITAVICIYPIAIIDFNLSNVVKFIAMFIVLVLMFVSPLFSSIIPIIAYIVAIVQCFTHNRPIAITILTIVLFLLLIVPKIIVSVSSFKNTDD